METATNYLILRKKLDEGGDDQQFVSLINTVEYHSFPKHLERQGLGTEAPVIN